MPKFSETQLLLILLKKVPDTKKVDRLLKPDNLFVLLPLYGQSQDQAQQRLSNGALPGELLFELLAHEPDADRLLAQLPDQDESAETAAPIPMLPLPQSGNPVLGDVIPPWKMPSRYMPAITHKGYSLFAEVCLFLAAITTILTVIILPMIASQFYVDVLPISLSPQVLTLMGVISGIVAGALAYPTFRSYRQVGFVVVVLNLGVLWCMLLYTHDKEWLWNVELPLAVLVGAIPACVLAYYLHRRAARK